MYSTVVLKSEEFDPVAIPVASGQHLAPKGGCSVEHAFGGAKRHHVGAIWIASKIHGDGKGRQVEWRREGKAGAAASRGGARRLSGGYL